MAQFYHPEELTLSNGIPVVFQHYEGSAAALYWWVRTGSCDENPKEAGFAHFLEHMLFKDAAAKETGRASTGKMARTIESLGGDINAYTSFDQTVYHVTCAAHHWERVIDSFGSIAVPQKFLKEDFEREREVVLEELRKNEDSPGRALFQSLFALTYRKHPYGRPVIGYAKTIKTAKVTDLEAFYRRNYVSSKMGLILVGPLPASDSKRKQQILKILEKRFGKKVLPKRAAKSVQRPLGPQQRNAPSFLVKPFDVNTPTLSFSFRVPDLKHEDVPALDLLAGVLGMGELSRLYQRLFYQTSLATEISGGLYVPNDPGMLYFQAELDSVSKIKPASEEIFRELRRLIDEGPTADEIERVLVNAESERLYATQTADGLAGRLGFSRFVLGDLNFDDRYLAQLRALDKDGLREIAARYLDPRRFSGVVMLPKTEGEYSTKELETAVQHILNPSGVSASVTKAATPAKKRVSGLTVEEFRLPSGIRVVYCPRPQSHAFSVHVSAMGGTRLEPEGGASHLLAETWNKGTAHRDVKQIANLVEGSAAHLEGFSGRNSIGLQMTGLARDWEKLSSLLGEVMLEPTFPEVEIEHARRVVEDNIRTLQDHSAQLCSQLFLETLFQSHPYGRLMLGSLESVKKINSELLKDLQHQWIQSQNLTISLSGAIKEVALHAWLNDLDRAFAQRPKHDKLPVVVAPEPPLKAPRWVEKNLGREQLHILVGGLGTRIQSEERYPIRLLQTLLGGQSGRLFIELREKKSLAYNVSPVSFEGIEPGYLGTYIACSPDKREEALVGIRSVLEMLVKKGPTKAEMERAKAYILGRRAMDLQSDGAIAAHYGLESLYGLAHLSDAELIKKIQVIRPSELQKICDQYLVKPHKVTSVVG